MEEESGSDRCKGAWRASRAASRPPVTVHEGACKATIFGKNHSRINIFVAAAGCGGVGWGKNMDEMNRRLLEVAASQAEVAGDWGGMPETLMVK